MIYLLTMFILFISACLVFYMRIKKKINLSYCKIKNFYEENGYDFYRLLEDMKRCFEISIEDDSSDKILNKEDIFKCNALKYFILRGFYNKISFAQFFVFYKLITKENADLKIDQWALDIIRDFGDNLNVFTYCLYRYKLGRIFVVIFHYLNLLSLNCNKVRFKYENDLIFIICLPVQFNHILSFIKDEKDSLINFINFYQLPKDDLMSWYRKDFI